MRAGSKPGGREAGVGAGGLSLKRALRAAAALWRRLGPLGFAVALGVGLGALAAAFPPSRASLDAWIAQARGAVLSQPDYLLRRVEVRGVKRASPKKIVDAMGLHGAPTSALAFDAARARSRVEAIGWILRAEVTLRTPHTVVVRVEERTPAALWRRRGKLTLVDKSGVALAEVRSERARLRRWARLPVVLGPDAVDALGEALILAERAESAGLAVAGLTRIGRRRWDLELLDGPRVMLPEAGAEAALERMLGWVRTADLLRRDLAVVDLRLPHAPTARRAAADRS